MNVEINFEEKTFTAYNATYRTVDEEKIYDNPTGTFYVTPNPRSLIGGLNVIVEWDDNDLPLELEEIEQEVYIQVIGEYR